MLKLLRATEITSETLEERTTVTESRFKPGYFTRNRKMPFAELLKFLLSMYKTSSQAALNQYFRGKEEHMTQQALSKARNHFDHTPFQKIFCAVRDAAYDEENIADMKRFMGLFLVAVDGSETALPNLPQLCEEFGGTGRCASSPTARMSIAYDVGNDFILDADMTALSTGERKLALRHLEQVGTLLPLKETLFIFDRGYPSKNLILELNQKTNYLMRVKKNFSKSVDAAPMGSSILNLYGISVRVVKLTLPSGETETLITNLFSLETELFLSLYFKRWPVEVKYDIVKNKLELPNFSGFTKNILMQDFWISMYLANMAAIAKAEADLKIQETRKEKNNKYAYQANVNLVIASFREQFALAVFSKSPEERIQKVNAIIYEVAASASPIRPNLNPPRYLHPRSSKFHHNKKSNL